MTSPSRHSLAVDQGAISYLEWGDHGPALHFAHANGFNALTYSALLSPLADGIHVLASDARGHGRTELRTESSLANGWAIFRDDLIATLEALHLPPLVLGGHSLGAITSLMLAIERPEHVGGLVLVEPVLVPENFSSRDNPGPMLAALTRRRREVFSSFDEVLNAYRGRGAFMSWPEEVLVDYLTGGLKQDGQGVRLACAPAWEAAIYDSSIIGAARLAARVTCPITLIHGDNQSTVPASEAELMVRAGARIVKVPGASHFLPMERPDIVRDEIRKMAGI